MRLELLIAASCGQPAADAYAAFQMTDEARSAMIEVGTALLRQHPPFPGACALMSALYVQGLRARLSCPVHLVAGELDVDGVRVFGRTGLLSEPMPFLRSDLDWDGHMWVMVGDYVADISLLCTGRSPEGHPSLKCMMAREFAAQDGLVIVKMADARRLGLDYLPDYVLTQEEIEGLERGARAALPVA